MYSKNIQVKCPYCGAVFSIPIGARCKSVEAIAIDQSRNLPGQNTICLNPQCYAGSSYYNNPSSRPACRGAVQKVLEYLSHTWRISPGTSAAELLRSYHHCYNCGFQMWSAFFLLGMPHSVWEHSYNLWMQIVLAPRQ